MLPPDPRLVEDPGEALELIDGLVLAGGADIDPALYGEAAHTRDRRTRCPSAMRSRSRSTRGAIERDLPVLGICRGMQLINVACGGTLLQHLPEHFGHEEHRRVTGSFDGADHEVRAERGLAGRARRGRARPRHQVPSPSGRGPAGGGSDRERHLDAGRAARGDRAAGPALRARRAVAPRGRHGQPGDRRACVAGVVDALPAPECRLRPRSP